MVTSPLVIPLIYDEKSNQDNGKESSIDDKIDQMFEEAGGCGLFQVFAYIAIAWGASSTAWFIYALGFYT